MGVRAALAAWGGYADGNSTLVGVVVVVVALAALAYVTRKWWRR
jgi:hypothetical protein